MEFLLVLGVFSLFFANTEKCNPLSRFPFQDWTAWSDWRVNVTKGSDFDQCFCQNVIFIFLSLFYHCFQGTGFLVLHLVYTFHLLVHVVLQRSIYLTDTLSSWRHRKNCVLKSFCFLHFTYLFVRSFKFYLDCLNFFFRYNVEFYFCIVIAIMKFSVFFVLNIM